MSVYQTVSLDATGASVVVGEGTAGTPTGGVLSIQGVSGGTNLPVAQGTAAASSGAWPVKVTDGTNVTAVKAASTTAVATDPAVVVSLSPNSPLSNFPSVVNTNYGTVGASTLRIASQIGNATGAADFNYGTAGAQTLRIASQIGNATGAADFNYGTAGAQTLRIASQIGNATGAANFGAGATGAQTLRVASNLYDGSANAITSTTINSKQRLDANIASEGTDGTAAPFQTLQIGGKDGSGNLQSVATDTSGNVFASAKIPTTPAAPGSASVGITSASAVAANSNRKGLIIINLSINTVSLNIVGGAAVLNSGITLYPGGVWYMDEFSFTTSAIFAIASVAASAIAIQEMS